MPREARRHDNADNTIKPDITIGLDLVNVALARVAAARLC